MTREFVPANRLFDVQSGERLAHPAYQATDDDVREAVRLNGGESA